MKRVMALWFVWGILSAGNAAFGDTRPRQYLDPEGFRGIAWGQHISTIPRSELEFRVKDDGIEYYTRKNDKLALGSISCEKIHYGFWRDKLFEARIIVQSGTEEMIEELEVVFGDYSSSKNRDVRWFYYEKSYVWEKPRTRIMLISPPIRWDKGSDTCTVIITSQKILKERDEYEQTEYLRGEMKGDL